MHRFNQMKYFLVHILDGLRIYGEEVEVLTDYPPNKRLPAVTMSSGGSRGHIETLVYKKMNPLPSDHPFFDPQAPETLYHTEELVENLFKGKLSLHVWSKSNEERDILVEKIIDTILKNKNKKFKEDLCVQLVNMGGAVDVDQFNSFPPLFHTTIELEFLYKTKELKTVTPLCKIEKEENKIL